MIAILRRAPLRTARRAELRSAKPRTEKLRRAMDS